MKATCWCETADGVHHPACEQSPMQLTKQQFVDSSEGGAKAALMTFIALVEDEDVAFDEAIEMAVEEARESAVCFAGIGACGTGCKHS